MAALQIKSMAQQLSRRLHDVGIERTPGQVVGHYVDRLAGYRPIYIWVAGLMSSALRDRVCFRMLVEEMRDDPQ